MAWNDTVIEDVRNAADIVAVISDHVTLRKMGTSWKGLCPFHQEKSPSFNVRQDPPVFHCFGCGEGGDVFKFVMLHDKISFPEAVEMLARRFGITLPESVVRSGPDRKEKDEVLTLLEAAADHFQRTLWSPAGQKARDYLLGRGFDRATLERIRAGAARDSWSDLVDALARRFSPAALAKAGLVVVRPEGGHYDRFRNRAIFPILNEAGKVVAFGARSLDGSEPKYLNSPESPVYQKGRILYGLSWARDPLRGGAPAVLMEGYLDVARALQCGVGGAVAACGTALTEGQARLLRRFTERIAVNFDQDPAGQKAARRSLEVLVEAGFAAQVVDLPPGHDPDSFMKAEGGDAYRARLASAPVWMDWLIARTSAEHDTAQPAGKAAFLNALLPHLARIESDVERAAWVPRLVAAGGLDTAATQREVKRAVAAREHAIRPEALAAPVRPAAPPRLLPAERLLLLLLVHGHEQAAEEVAGLGEEDVEGLVSAPVLLAAGSLAEGRPRGGAALIDRVKDVGLQQMLTALAQGDAPAGVDPRECVREIRRRPLQLRLEAIRRKLASGTPVAVGEGRGAGAGSDDWDVLLREKQRLEREMAAL